MLNLDEKIEQLLKLIAVPPCYKDMGLLARMYAWTVLCAFNKVNHDLEVLSAHLDTSIDLDVISIDFKHYYSLFADEKDSFDDTKSWGLIEGDESHQSEINWMTDYLPNGNKGYNTTPEVLNSFKTAMHQLGDEDKIGTRDLMFAINMGMDTTLRLLKEIDGKMKSPELHLYLKLWDEIQNSCSEDDFDYNYQRWLDDTGVPTFDELKARQKQEIFEFLRTGFFRFAKPPTGNEVKNRKLKIGEDDLEVGTEIPEDFDINCAKFDRFIEWKEDILVLQYEKLGRYIYNNYKSFDINDFYVIVSFDKLLDIIHEEMAKRKPSLAKYLKRYAENELEQLFNDCRKILNSCKPFISKNLRDTFLEEYLEFLLFESDVKEEARKKLGGQSRKTYICGIVTALGDRFVFNIEYNNNDFARVLCKEMDSVDKETLIRYLKNRKNVSSALSDWTKRIFDDLMKQPYKRRNQDNSET